MKKQKDKTVEKQKKQRGETQIVTRRKQIGWNDRWVKEHAKIRVFINPLTLKTLFIYWIRTSTSTSTSTGA